MNLSEKVAAAIDREEGYFERGTAAIAVVLREMMDRAYDMDEDPRPIVFIRLFARANNIDLEGKP